MSFISCSVQATICCVLEPTRAKPTHRVECVYPAHHIMPFWEKPKIHIQIWKYKLVWFETEYTHKHFCFCWMHIWNLYWHLFQISQHIQVALVI
jgi:hypothetical protein